MNPLPTPALPLDEPQARRYRLINEELARIYPAVCVEGSPQREAFLRLMEDGEAHAEWALVYAFISLDNPDDALPEPRSPRLHPSTVEEQLAYVVVPDVEFANATARDALDFLLQEAWRLGSEMNQALEYDLKERPQLVSLVPESILRESRVTLTLHHVPLAAALRHVVEAVGLHARLQEAKLLVCSEGVAKAPDMSTVYGHQDLLWDLAGYLPPKDRRLTVRDRENLAEGWPDSLVVGTEDHTRLSAHYLLYGEPDTALDFGSLLFDWHEMSTPLGSFERYKAQEDWSDAGAEN